MQNGCFFHFIQALYRKIRSLALVSSYSGNMTTRNVIRKIIAVALLLEKHIPVLFVNIGQELNDDERNKLDDLFRYFNDYWMHQILIWNVFDMPEKSNNVCEGICKKLFPFIMK